MHYVVLALVLLLAVAACGIVARLSPLRLPLPLIQIAAGALLGGPLGVEIPLDPEIFFLLFIPPLLFLDGWRIPKGAFFRDLRPILTLAVGLVIFTVVGIGFFIHWLLPSMPLGVAFAVAAILAPTDPVAVSAVRGDAPMPPRMQYVLEGEALLNDASGLDLFRIGVAAVVTGSFSLMQTAVGFVWVACAGVAIGVGVSFVSGYALRGLARIGGEDTGVQILVSLLLPFAAYLAAEHLGGSGILAAATAGIASQYVNLHGSELSATRMERRVVWNMVQGVMNGIIFVLLGEQLVRIVSGDLGELQQRHIGAGTLLFHAMAITAALLALRFVWVWVPLHFAGPLNILLDWRGRLLLVTAVSVAGVRGAITLAGVLSLPLLLPDGSPFPARHLAVVIATGVILLSLLLASCTLPALVRRLPSTPHLQTRDDELGARQAAARAAIARLESRRSEIEDSSGDAAIEREALEYLLASYRRRLTSGDSETDDRIWALASAERQLRLAALAAERDQLYQLRIRHQIDDELHRKLVLEVDLVEASLDSGD